MQTRFSPSLGSETRAVLGGLLEDDGLVISVANAEKW